MDPHDDVRAAESRPQRSPSRPPGSPTVPPPSATERVERVADGGQASAPFAGWRIVELSSGIAASYCGKMFADAGAEVVKVEPPHGDPMRRWSAGGTPGALFGYLAAAKGSVLRGDEEAALIAGADLVVTDLSDGWSLEDLTAPRRPVGGHRGDNAVRYRRPLRRRADPRQRVHPPGSVRFDREPRLARLGTLAGRGPNRRMAGRDFRRGGGRGGRPPRPQRRRR